MSQTLAIFHDAYRGLRARKMFWIVLFLSLFVVVCFACIGVNEQGLTLLVWDLGSGPTSEDLAPAMLYKVMFVAFGIGFWLTWVAAILALISTAGLFPNFIAKGAVDLVVARPISRLRLFLTQYAAGLLFVTLQITVFSLASFLVLGLRGGAWEPGMFLAVPLVVCFFSYLYCVCVLLGVWTRSTLAALLLTLLFWGAIFIVHAAETGLLAAKTMAQYEQRSAQAEAETKPHGTTTPADRPPPPASDGPSADDRTIRHLETAHRIAYGVKSVLPKTSETVALIERVMISTADLPGAQDDGGDPNGEQAARREMTGELRSRSPWWIVGTSLGFEAVVLALASWVFCRRDF